MRYFLFITLLLSSLSIFAQNKHVRIILDTSQSMGLKSGPITMQNDLEHLAVLSTQLLYDLVRPVGGDSFAVIPFDKDWPRAHKKMTLPTSKRSFIRHTPFKSRIDFLSEIRRLKYNSSNTYFYPALKRAINDLSKITNDDIKVIVLLTDGLPEKKAKELEYNAIVRDLLPQFKNKQIKLFILSFSKSGPNAYTNKQNSLEFFQNIIQPSGSSEKIGTHTAISDTNELLKGMIEIFTLGFGYQAEPLLNASRTQNLPLTQGNFMPKDVAVIAYHNKNRTPPAFNIKKSQNVNLSNPDKLQSAFVKGENRHIGASYALRWILSPDPKGKYQLDMVSHSKKIDLFILRPAPVEIELLPRAPDTQILETMATKTLHLSALIRSKIGGVTMAISGEDLAVSYELYGSYKGGKRIKLTHASPPIAKPRGSIRSKGRIYDLDITFPHYPNHKNRYYQGFIKIQITRKGVRISHLTHNLEVYPPLNIKADPRIMFISNQVLERGDKACQLFKFTLNEGQLTDPNYGVQAYLKIPKNNQLKEELFRSVFTLDGDPLYPKNHIFPPTSKRTINKTWVLGKKLTQDKLINQHEICLTIGTPTKGAISTPIQISIGFILNKSPYDTLEVIDPLTIKVKVAPPTLLEKYISLLFFLIPLLLLLLLWYSRNRPSLSPDLGYHLMPYEKSKPLPTSYPELVKLEEPFLIFKFLGFITKKVVKDPNTKEFLVWVVPVKNLDELYQIKPDNKQIEIIPFPQEEGALGLAYWITTKKQTYLLQLGYFE